MCTEYKERRGGLFVPMWVGLMVPLSWTASILLAGLIFYLFSQGHTRVRAINVNADTYLVTDVGSIVQGRKEKSVLYTRTAYDGHTNYLCRNESFPSRGQLCRQIFWESVFDMKNGDVREMPLGDEKPLLH